MALTTELVDPSVIKQYNIATTYLDKKKYDRAIAEYKKVLKQYEFKEAYLNLGNAYKFSGLDRMSFESYSKALSAEIPFLDKKSRGRYTLALNNLGLYYFMFDKLDSAIKLYDEALEINPTFWDAAWNKATAVLKKACDGDNSLFLEGWGLYKARFLKTPPVTLKNDLAGLQPWEGSHVPSLVVLVEQGIGDSIMWGRYLDSLSTLVDKLWVQCDPSLTVLFSKYNICLNASTTDATHAVAMCDLPGYFNSGVPIPAEGWLPDNLPTARVFRYDKPNIGVVWSGSASHVNDAYRSVPMYRFHALAKYANLYSLSPDFTGSKHIKSLGIKNWSDTISALRGLDLVISVDTSVVHLAGTLGIETWLLQPYKETDFRWGTDASGSDNVWYSSVRVFRNPQDWDFVFAQVLTEFKDRFAV